MDNKKPFPGELALLIGLTINSFAVSLMVVSDFGISTISSFPYVVSKALPALTFGAWNYIFQTGLLVSLALLTKRFSFGYVVSFATGIAFGVLLDIFYPFVALLPLHFAARIAYFAVSFAIMAVGISLLINCGLPVIPVDLFPRDLANHFHCTYKRVKTTFDIVCLCLTLAISLLILRQMEGVGAGTVICAFITGKAVSICSTYLTSRYDFAPRFITPRKRA